MSRLIIFLLSIALLLVCFTPARTLAEGSGEIRSSNSDVTVLPAKFDLSSSHGRTINQSLKIINSSDSDYLFALSIDNIGVTGENGEVGIGSGAPRLTNLLSSWITTDNASGKLEAQSTKIINFQIKVPEITEPGGKYASMVISLDKTERNLGESSAIAKVVSLVMLTVAGDYEDNAKLITFDISKNLPKEIAFTSRIRNQGVAHVKPVGSIIISNLFGQKVGEIEFNGENVLPGSVRKTISKWQPERSMFGIYTATLVANYGQKQNSVITTAKNFFVFPFWSSLLAIILTFAIGFGIVGLAKQLLSKKQPQ